MRSERGDWVGQGQTVTYTPTDAPFVVRRNTPNGVSVGVLHPSFAFWWYLDSSAPAGAPLALGYYPTATRYPFTEFVGLSIGGSGRGCNELTGRFLVRDIEYAANGDVLRLAIDAEQHCEDLDPALFVAVRYNSDVPTDIFPGDTALSA
jgi:hypothetical protein